MLRCPQKQSASEILRIFAPDRDITPPHTRRDFFVRPPGFGQGNAVFVAMMPGFLFYTRSFGCDSVAPGFRD
jgi:hypothetical protein